MPDQCLEELPLGRREMNLLRRRPRLIDHMVIEINGPPSELHGFDQLRLRRTPRHRSNPRQQLLHTERLGDIVVRTGVKGIHLGRAVHPAGENHNGHLRPLTKRADDINAIDVRQAEIEDDQVWMSVGCCLEGAPTGSGGDDGVLPRVQVDSQGAQDLRLVIDDQDTSHDRSNAVCAGSGMGRVTAGSEIVMVSPPPGVPSGLRVPDMASISPRDKARPRPTPLVLSRSPSRWNGWKIWFQSASGIPGPQSMTRISTAMPRALAVICGGALAGLWRMAVCTRLAIARSSRAGSAETSGVSSGTRMITSYAAGPKLLTAAEMTSATSIG